MEEDADIAKVMLKKMEVFIEGNCCQVGGRERLQASASA